MNMYISYLKVVRITCAFWLSLVSLTLYAQDPITEVVNECTFGGVGEACTSQSDCTYEIATECVNTDYGKKCMPPCSETGQCALGEICVTDTLVPDAYYCQTVPFRMDLNLLDQCIKLWVAGRQPTLSQNQCSLEANLNRLLDQNQDFEFDLFDLDLCILSFLEQPSVGDGIQTCDPNQGNLCGLGSYCDPEREDLSNGIKGVCTRECGLVSSREPGGDTIDRECSGHLKTCDYVKGKCEAVPIEEIEKSTCQIDRDCISGAYCFLGQCAPLCYRSVDCPSSEWYCTENNRCRALPSPNDNEDDFVFEPSNYAIKFTRKDLSLNAVQTKDSSPLAIMDLISRQQVIGNAAINFGYRTRITYNLKEDVQCLKNFKTCDLEDSDVSAGDEAPAACRSRRADCIIDPDESWILLPSPFGLVNAAQNPKFEVQLDETIVESLSPGKYTANVEVIYDNGATDELRVTYIKETISGKYVGNFAVYYELNGKEYPLFGADPMNLSMSIYVNENETTTWSALSHRILGDGGYIDDVAEGQKVYAKLHGDYSLSFANPNTLIGNNRGNNDIDFEGIFYPNRGVLRILGLIQIPAVLQKNDLTNPVQAYNYFDSDITRRLEFFGRMNEKTSAVFGYYTETISGLNSTDFTLKGLFNIAQVIADSTPIISHVKSTTITQPTPSDVRSKAIKQVKDQALLSCHPDLYEYFKDFDDRKGTNFNRYLASATKLFPNLVQFSDLIGEALGALGSEASLDEWEYLTIYDYLRGRIKICDEDTDTCTTDADCGADYSCNDDEEVCVATPKKPLIFAGTYCESHLQCNDNQYCDPDTNICLSPQINRDGTMGECVDDNDCWNRCEGDDCDTIYSCTEHNTTIHYIQYGKTSDNQVLRLTSADYTNNDLDICNPVVEFDVCNDIDLLDLISLSNGTLSSRISTEDLISGNDPASKLIRAFGNFFGLGALTFSSSASQLLTNSASDCFTKSVGVGESDSDSHNYSVDVAQYVQRHRDRATNHGCDHPDGETQEYINVLAITGAAIGCSFGPLGCLIGYGVANGSIRIDWFENGGCERYCGSPNHDKVSSLNNSNIHKKTIENVSTNHCMYNTVNFECRIFENFDDINANRRVMLEYIDRIFRRVSDTVCTSNSQCGMGETCEIKYATTSPFARVGEERYCTQKISAFRAKQVADYLDPLIAEQSTAGTDEQATEFKKQVCVSHHYFGEALTSDFDEFEFKAYKDYAGDDQTLCISGKDATCGLSIMQLALLEGWVDFDQMDTLNRSKPLFCDETIDLNACFDVESLKDEDGTVLNPPNNSQKIHFVSQEHNRFWMHLMQGLKFTADQELSDAFMTLYRNQLNPFSAGSAMAYKGEKQANAIALYNQLMNSISNIGIREIYQLWDMSHYLQRGDDLLKLLKTISSDRLEAIATMVDLDRRVYDIDDLTSKNNIVQNMIQVDYIFQVYLLYLQMKWQGDSPNEILYDNASGLYLNKAQQILQQVNVGRNVLGLFDHQVYFENTLSQGTLQKNWQHYRSILLGDEGILVRAEEDLDQAVNELKASLSDLDSLEEKIYGARREISGFIAAQCGAPASEIIGNIAGIDQLDDMNGDGQADYCDYLLAKYSDDELTQQLIACKLGGESNSCENLAISSDASTSDFSIKCNGETIERNEGDSTANSWGTSEKRCNNVISEFKTATAKIIGKECPDNTSETDLCTCPDGTTERNGICFQAADPLTGPARCDLNRYQEYAVYLGGKRRVCSGGAMASLIQEKRLLEFKREQVIGSVETILKHMVGPNGIGKKLWRQCIATAPGDNSIGAGEYCHSPRNAFNILSELSRYAKFLKQQYDDALKEQVAESIKEGIGGANCEIIAGLAVGTNCPQSVAVGIGKSGVTALNIVSSLVFFFASEIPQMILETTKELYQATGDQADTEMELEQKLREIDNLITEFQTLTTEIFNVNVKIEDLKYQIKVNFETYQDDVAFIIDHLIGRESGNILLGRKLVSESDRKFRDVLNYTYRMLMAFVHQYNIAPTEASSLKGQLFSSITLDDIRDFISYLDRYALEYCGRESIDCDTDTNIEILKVSLRQLLRPDLQTIVDARTGDVLTAGQQFHNIITQPPYLKQRIVNNLPADFIEFSFGVPLYMQESGPQGPQWMINPFECNHFLATARTDLENVSYTGNVAANFLGVNLGEGERGIEYEWVRGSSDYLRSCHSTVETRELGLLPEQVYPIHTYTVGYAPQSPEANMETAPSYVSRSGFMPACINEGEEASDLARDSYCWRSFARGRSLSASDWKIRIPIRIDGAATSNTWILGDGLRQEEKPIIDDIVLYFRYYARPTDNN